MYCININCSSPAIEASGITNCPSCGGGLLLHDRYYPTSLLGQGGFGRTYRAIDTHNPQGKLCVIKQFIFQSASSSTNKTAVDLFYQEAKHLESLGDHPQVPSLIDYFDEAGQHYLVQEYIDGENLERELSIEGRFGQEQIREILESLLPVLDWLHHRSIPVIHRDIKPANIIRRRSDGKLVLVDFGAAKLASETLLAKTGTSIGSAEYAAPEQVRGKPTFASDIYSLGVTCIHLLTSIPPFDLYSVAENDWDWQNSLEGNKVNEKLGEVIDKMINPALSRRYRSALEALSALQNSQEIVAVIPEAVERFEMERILDHAALKTTKMFGIGKIVIPESLRTILLPHNLNLIPLSGVSVVGFFSGQFSLLWIRDSLISLAVLKTFSTAFFQFIDVTLSLIMCILPLLFLSKARSSYVNAREFLEMGYSGAAFRECLFPYMYLAVFCCFNQIGRMIFTF
jgi:serine/threonine protein kinase